MGARASGLLRDSLQAAGRAAHDPSSPCGARSTAEFRTFMERFLDAANGSGQGVQLRRSGVRPSRRSSHRASVGRSRLHRVRPHCDRPGRLGRRDPRRLQCVEDADYNMILAGDPEAMPADWEATRQRYFTINWLQLGTTWRVRPLPVASISLYGPPHFGRSMSQGAISSSEMRPSASTKW